MSAGIAQPGSAADASLSSDFLVLRYTKTGKLDRSFGNGGIVLTSFNQPAALTRVYVEPSGAIDATGKTTAALAGIDPSAVDVAVARYTSKGQPDTSFNGTGQGIFSLNDDPGPLSLISPRGRLLLAPAALVPQDAAADLAAEFAQLISTAQGVLAITPGGQLLVAGNSGSDTVEAQLIVSGLDLVSKLIGAFPAAVVGGAKGAAQVQITEAGTEMAVLTVTIDLFPGAAGSSPIASFQEKLRLKPNQSKTFKLKFNFPSSMPDGDYFLLSFVDPGSASDVDLVNNAFATAAPVNIAKAFVDLSGASLSTPAFTSGKPAKLSFDVTNNGNVAAITTISVAFFASTDGTLTNATPLQTLTVKLNLKPGATKLFKQKLSAPTGLAAGSYVLLALLDARDTLHDPVTANNLLVSGGTFTVA